MLDERQNGEHGNVQDSPDRGPDQAPLSDTDVPDLPDSPDRSDLAGGASGWGCIKLSVRGLPFR